MARRSPQNERYGKYTAPSGKTRKSAAAAKPKRDSVSAPAKKSSAKKTTAREPLIVNPPTPEFQAMRRVWWGLLGGSLVFTAGSLALRQWLHAPVVANIMLAVGYAGIFAALYVDWAKLRPMRKKWLDEQKSGRGKS